MKRIWIVSGLAAAIGLLVVLGILIDKPGDAPKQTSTHTTATQSVNATTVAGFDKQRHSLTEASSLWVIANRSHPLPRGYTPAELVVPKVLLRLAATEEQMKVSSVMSPALEALFAAAKQDGITLKLSSAYRSEALQAQFYNSYKARDGEAAADRYSARPGTSEHQTGLSADIITANDQCHLEICFGELVEGKWLAAHAHEHGFIIRYLNNKEASTGYQYEPWHIRYVGPELASELYKSGQTMEEFFNL